MSDKYRNVIRAVAETPWAILPEKLTAIHDLIELRAAGERFTDEEIQARIGPRSTSAPTAGRAGNVAIIPLSGTIAPKADLMTQISGGTSLQTFQQQLREAAADPDVSAIVLDVDSPGGSTAMLTEAAAEIRAARGKKPVVAVANPMMASAAYHLGSQASEIVSTPSGLLGSIGVYGVHADFSAQNEKDGVKFSLISAGKHKVDGNPYEPLSEAARASAQERVDETYATMTRDIAAGRKTSADAVRNGYGEGRVLTARKALAEGMVDRIDTLESTIARVGALAAPKNGAQVAYATGGMITGTAVVHPGETIIPLGQPPGSSATSTVEAAASGLFYAPIGASWDEEQAAIAKAALDYIDRMSSLAEARTGRLSGAKRDALTSFEAACREAASRSAALLNTADPDKARAALIAEAARYERHRAA